MAEPGPITSPSDKPVRESGLPGWKRSLRNPVVIGLLLAAATLIAYLPSFHAGFVTYDDPDYVTDNVHVKAGLTGTGLKWAFGTGHAGNWHPLTWVSHMLDVQWYGLNPVGHHVTSVLFHVANAILLFILIRRLTGALWRSAFVAALFALHPLHTESVAWISERKDVLSAFFFFLTLWAYAGYAGRSQADSSPSSASHRMRLYVLSLVFFALGLMSKPMLVTVPCVLLLIDYWPMGRLHMRTAAWRIAEKIPYFGLSAASCVVTLVVQKEAEQPLANLPIAARIANTVVSYARYVGKLFWPFDLVTPYPHPGHWPMTEVLLAALLLGALTLAAILTRRKFPFLLVGWLWFLGMLVPVIGLVQVGEQSMADRYTYLPLIGLFIALTWAAAAAASELRLPSVAVAAGAGILVILCAVRTADQDAYWHGSESLYRHAVRVSKNNFIAYYNLGSYFDSQGNIDAALTNYLKAVEIQPHYQDPLNNIGVLYATRKQFGDAVPYFEAALRAKPDFTEVEANLANTLRELKRFKEAIPHYRAVLEKRPQDVSALNGLGNALSSQRQYAAAVQCYLASIRARPNQSAAHYDLANALANLGQNNEAMEEYRLVLQQNPEHAQAYNDLGIALARQGRLDEALVQLRQAIHYGPSNAVFYLNLGKALAAQHKFDEAISEYHRALQLAPDHADVHSALGSALAASGKLEEGISQFQIALGLQPDNPVVHFNFGRALAAGGKREQAIQQFAEALRLKPDFTPARVELQALTNGNAQ